MKDFWTERKETANDEIANRITERYQQLLREASRKIIRQLISEEIEHDKRQPDNANLSEGYPHVDEADEE